MASRAQPPSPQFLDLALKLVDAPSASIPEVHREAVVDLVEALVGELQPLNLFETVEICELAQTYIEIAILRKVQRDLVEGRSLKLLADMPEEIFSGIPEGADEFFEGIGEFERPARKIDDHIRCKAFLEVSDQFRSIGNLISLRQARLDQQIAKWKASARSATGSQIGWRGTGR